MKKILPWIFLLLAPGFCLGIAYLPLPVQPYLDFQVIYHAGMGLLRGIPLYDHADQVNMIAELASVQADQVFVLPFPYPPWYALALLPLFFLPISVAARLWLELNLSMLVLSILLLTEGWNRWKRLAVFSLALTFLPVLGAFYVGQYIFPVLLGTALFVYAQRHEQPFLTALSIALLSFKPHLGSLIGLAGLVYLWQRQDAYSRRALRTSFTTMLFLCAVGFLADPLWPLNYFKSLTSFRFIGAVSSCNLCASLPVMLSNLSDSGGLRLAVWLAGGLLLVFLSFLYWKGRRAFFSPDLLAATFVTVTLLASPYLLNYDFVLLLIPLILLVAQARTWRAWSMIGLIYLLPWLGLGLFNRQGNVAMILSALLLAGWLYQQLIKTLLDPRYPDMYNQENSLREE